MGPGVAYAMMHMRRQTTQHDIAASLVPPRHGAQCQGTLTFPQKAKCLKMPHTTDV